MIVPSTERYIPKVIRRALCSAGRLLTFYLIGALSLLVLACNDEVILEGVKRVGSVEGPVALHTLTRDRAGTDDLLVGGPAGLHVARGGPEGLAPPVRVDRGPVASGKGAMVPFGSDGLEGVLARDGGGLRWYPIGRGALKRSRRVPIPWDQTLALARADLDGDGGPEAVALGSRGDTLLLAEVYPEAEGESNVLWAKEDYGQPGRRWLLAVDEKGGEGCDAPVLAGFGAGGRHLGRFRCEGYPDLLLEALTAEAAPADLVVADLDGDDSDEVVWADLETGLRWWTGRDGGDGTVQALDSDFSAFEVAQIVRSEGISQTGLERAIAALPPGGELVDEARLAVLDYDGDGDADLVAVSPSDGKLRLYVNGNDGLGTGVTVGSGFRDIDALTVGEFDDVPGPDLALAADGRIWVVPGALLAEAASGV